MRPSLSWTSHFFSGVLVVAIGAILAFTVGAPFRRRIYMLGASGSGGNIWRNHLRLQATGAERGGQRGCPMGAHQSDGPWHAPLSRLKTRRPSVKVGSIRVADVLASEHLAVAINGTLFSSKSGCWRRSLAKLATNQRR